MFHKKRAKESKKHAELASSPSLSQKPLPARPNEQDLKVAEDDKAKSKPLDSRIPALRNKGIPKSFQRKPLGLPRPTTSKSSNKPSHIATQQSTKESSSRNEVHPRHARSTSEDVPLIMDTSLYTALSVGTGSSEYSFPPPPAMRLVPAQSALDNERDTVLGIALPEKALPPRPSELPPRLIPELQALAAQGRSIFAIPPQTSDSVSSPSTHFTGSPTVWSAPTATTTPTSLPSTSPGLGVPLSAANPVNGSHSVSLLPSLQARLPKLANPEERVEDVKVSPSNESNPGPPRTPSSKIRRKPVADSAAPTPPPRTSSIKRKAIRSVDKSNSSSIDETLSRAAASSSTAPSSADPDFSPLKKGKTQQLNTVGESLHQTELANVHDVLQQSIKVVPVRPSREGTLDLGESRPSVMTDSRHVLNRRHGQLLLPAFRDNDTHGTNNTRSETETQELSVSQSLPEPQGSPKKLGKMSRLGLLARQGRSPSLDNDKKNDKTQRKGPAAGTGHEGYGKYGKRGRKSSTDVSNKGSDSERSRSSSRRIPYISSLRKGSFGSSKEKSATQADLDEFVIPRLKPVAIRGGSQTSLDTAVSTEPATTQTSTYQVDEEQGITTSPTLVGQEADVSIGITGPDIGEVAESSTAPYEATRFPPLALRRSQKFGPGIEGFQFPTPIRTDNLVPPQQAEGNLYPSTATSAVSSASANDQYSFDFSSTKAIDQKSRRPWWNPFRRKHDDTEDAPIEPYSAPDVDSAMVVSVTAGPLVRSIPYYVMMESESEINNTEMLDAYLLETANSSKGPPSLSTEDDRGSELQRYTDSVLLPAAPVLPKPQLDSQPQSIGLQTSEFEPSRTKQPRLAQVGRIPKVVPRSERQHVPSRQSFSQPFHRKLPFNTMLPEGWGVLSPPPEKPVLEIRTDVLPSRTFNGLDSAEAKPVSAPVRSYTNMLTDETHYQYPPNNFDSRRDSGISGSSSSDGIVSVLGPPLLPTKSPQRPEGPSGFGVIDEPHSDDEVWNEYDDFIDHVMSPVRSNLETNETQSAAQLADQLHSINVTETSSTSYNNANTVSPAQQFVSESYHTASLVPPVLYPAPSLLSERSVGEDIRLSRSRIISALHSSMDPSSPFSLREFLNEYGERYRDSLVLREQPGISNAASSGFSTSTSRAALPENILPQTEQSHQQSVSLLDVVERNKNPVAQSELHYASLEVARWLSFGRVLFSPAHDEIHTLPERHVLVVDGLGNEDWSIYCAVTYESERAIVYDLRETKKPRGALSQPEVDDMPANYRRAEITDLSERFPFQSSFFSAIVLRFCPAMAEGKLKNIISECRRILVPGGHLEVMLLDLDIVNMGIQTRRAVRELKIRMTTKDPSISLKPMIDNFQTLLGGRGFSSLNRCVVGVPVAGHPAGTVDSSSSSPSRSSRTSGAYSSHASGDSAQLLQRVGKRKAQPRRDANFSLNDLVADHSENADAKIGKMVSKTARSWWQHCYEASVIRDGDLSQSIFANRKVLGECKSKGSSFKLLIAYAQRPVFESKRRTMSEPGIPTLATAGASRMNKVIR